MNATPTIEEKRTIVTEHFQVAYHVKFKRALTNAEVENYYGELLKLRRSEKRFLEPKTKESNVLNLFS